MQSKRLPYSTLPVGGYVVERAPLCPLSYSVCVSVLRFCILVTVCPSLSSLCFRFVAPVVWLVDWLWGVGSLGRFEIGLALTPWLGI
jgi:hypothetical protein